jgi:hypothetical protein
MLDTRSVMQMALPIVSAQNARDPVASSSCKAQLLVMTLQVCHVLGLCRFMHSLSESLYSHGRVVTASVGAVRMP